MKAGNKVSNSLLQCLWRGEASTLFACGAASWAGWAGAGLADLPKVSTGHGNAPRLNLKKLESASSTDRQKQSTADSVHV